MAGGHPPQQPQQPQQPYGGDPNQPVVSDKEKVIAGALQLLPLIIGIGGIGRLYTGHIGTGIAQIILSFFCIGYIWSIIDGILIFVNGGTDAEGRPLK